MKPYLLFQLLIFSTVQLSYFHYGTFMIPHPEKAHRGGEDAFLAHPNLLVVSDGVGGWNQVGINPSLFSKTLCSNSHTLFTSNPSFYQSRPQELMAQAVKNNHNQGSATMVVVTLDSQGIVHAANLGDSGYKILRRSPNGNFGLIFQSQEQQHNFNFPFQLAAPENAEASGDNPYLSELKEHAVAYGDFLVIGSDGLFDNIYIEDLMFLLKKEGQFTDDGLMMNKDHVAKVLAETAMQYATDAKRLSPFAKAARQAGFSDISGGKLDDTTVIIAQILSRSDVGNTQL